MNAYNFIIRIIGNYYEMKDECLPFFAYHENAQRAHSPHACWSVAEIPLIGAAGIFNLKDALWSYGV